jgi:hypothetical protein
VPIFLDVLALLHPTKNIHIHYTISGDP